MQGVQNSLSFVSLSVLFVFLLLAPNVPVPSYSMSVTVQTSSV